MHETIQVSASQAALGKRCEAIKYHTRLVLVTNPSEAKQMIARATRFIQRASVTGLRDAAPGSFLDTEREFQSLVFHRQISFAAIAHKHEVAASRNRLLWSESRILEFSIAWVDVGHESLLMDDLSA